MIVRCAICGHRQHVILPYDWLKCGRSKPDIWICDVHQKEFVA